MGKTGPLPFDRGALAPESAGIRVSDGAEHLPLAGTSVLVTGATGKVGRRLVAALLAEQVRVSILTRQPRRARDLWPGASVEARSGDLTDPSGLGPALQGVDAVLHLASHSPGPTEGDADEAPGHWTVTVEGTRNLLRAAAGAGVRRLVYLSSVKAMGDAAGAGPAPATEATPARPERLYGRAKLAAERLVLAFGEDAQRHASVLRLPMVYGFPGEGSVARMIEALARNRFPPWPRLANRRSAVHVDDAVRATLLALTHPGAKGQVYLLTDGCDFSTRWLYEQILVALGRPVPRWSVPLWLLLAAATVGSGVERVSGRAMPLTRSALAKLTGDARYSSEKIRRELGFVPRCRLAEEIPRLVRAALEGGG